MRSEPPAPTYLSGIATPDDKTVVFTLTRPDAMSFIFWVLDSRVRGVSPGYIRERPVQRSMGMVRGRTRCSKPKLAKCRIADHAWPAHICTLERPLPMCFLLPVRQ